jgi:hypothetical protein
MPKKSQINEYSNFKQLLKLSLLEFGAMILLRGNQTKIDRPKMLTFNILTYMGFLI